MHSFNDFNFSGDLQETIRRSGFVTPTLIQKDSIPKILEGRDVIGESSTGSGKTLAFACGILENTVERGGIQSLVLAPTRELTEQVKESIQNLVGRRRLIVAGIYGGVQIVPQIRQLRKAEIVVATPGRLIDHLERRTINLSKVKLLVLDEADRMIDMGFINDVEKIISHCPQKRQTLFFSATIDSRIQSLSKNYMVDPFTVSASTMVDPSKLKQVYYPVQRHLKLSFLIHLLNQERKGLSMIFCNTRRMTDFVTKNLNENSIQATAIHGGLTQSLRTRTMKGFNKSVNSVLVCTDVAARGLHIGDVSHVYNYDISGDPKDYIHRIGRTARAGKDGMVVNLISDWEDFSKVLREFRDMKVKKLELPRFDRIRMVYDNSNGVNQQRSDSSKVFVKEVDPKKPNSYSGYRENSFGGYRKNSGKKPSFRGGNDGSYQKYGRRDKKSMRSA
jgi:ATP-dependent RNA helicase DeaD